MHCIPYTSDHNISEREYIRTWHKLESLKFTEIHHFLLAAVTRLIQFATCYNIMSLFSMQYIMPNLSVVNDSHPMW